MNNHLPNNVMIPDFNNQHLMQGILHHKVKRLVPNWV